VNVFAIPFFIDTLALVGEPYLTCGEYLGALVKSSLSFSPETVGG